MQQQREHLYQRIGDMQHTNAQLQHPSAQLQQCIASETRKSAHLHHGRHEPAPLYRPPATGAR